MNDATSLRSWVEIDLGALMRNAARLRERLGDARLIAVVKKDAYGHGMLECAHALEAAGDVAQLAVCTVDEGLALRDDGVNLPILVLSPVVCEDLGKAAEANLVLTVLTAEEARRIDGVAAGLGLHANVHFKVDSGMARLGCYPEQARAEMSAIRELLNVRVSGIYSHLADVDGDADYTAEQQRRFLEFCDACAPPDARRHLAQSGVWRRPELALRGARVGLALYGAYEGAPELEPVMTFKSRVIFKKRVPSGSTISYGRTYTAARDLDVAVVGAGYGNGYVRSQSNSAQVSVAGRRAPVIGVVCMDQFMVDAGGLGACAVGDEALLFGQDRDVALPVWEAATRAGTIPYELCCLAGGLNPRIFLH